MEKIFQNVIKVLFDANITNIQEIGGGCYGKIFKLNIDTPPSVVCIKTYFYPNMAVRQAKDYTELKKRTSVPTLKVLSDNNIHYGYNLLVTEYTEGSNCAFTDIPEQYLNRLGKNIAQNLAKIHQADNIAFGDLGNAIYQTWSGFYKVKLKEMWSNISSKTYNKNSLKILKTAMDNIDLFPLHCDTPSLIHGDFNTSNILIDCNYEITAIIDPMNMFYGDREYDLFQLDIYNGKQLLLMENYSNIFPLSKNFKYKNALYKAFAEYNHYATINAMEDEHLHQAIDELKIVLQTLNISI